MERWETVQVTIRVPKDLLEKADGLALKRRLSRSDIFIQALLEYFETSPGKITKEEIREAIRSDPSLLREAVRNIKVQFVPEQEPGNDGLN